MNLLMKMKIGIVMLLNSMIHQQPMILHLQLHHRQLLHRQLWHRQLLHQQLLHRQLLHRQLLHRQLLHRQTPQDVWEPVDANYNPNVGFTAKPGILCDSLTVDSLPVEFFKCFVTDEVVDLLVSETNRFADQFLASATLTPKSRSRSWVPTDSTEMHKFLGLVLMMGMNYRLTVSLTVRQIPKRNSYF